MSELSSLANILHPDQQTGRVGCRYGLVWSHTAGREHGCLNVLYILASVVASVVCIEFWEVNICTVWRSFGDCRVLKVSLIMVYR